MKPEPSPLTGTCIVAPLPPNCCWKRLLLEAAQEAAHLVGGRIGTRAVAVLLVVVARGDGAHPAHADVDDGGAVGPRDPREIGHADERDGRGLGGGEGGEKQGRGRQREPAAVAAEGIVHGRVLVAKVQGAMVAGRRPRRPRSAG